LVEWGPQPGQLAQQWRPLRVELPAGLAARRQLLGFDHEPAATTLEKRWIAIATNAAKAWMAGGQATTYVFIVRQLEG
jgi:hypothetical protein